MKIMELELTERQAEIFDEVMEKVDETAIFLAGLSHEERLDWLKNINIATPLALSGRLAALSTLSMPISAKRRGESKSNPQPQYHTLKC